MELGEQDWLSVQPIAMARTILSQCECPVVIAKVGQGKEA